MLNHVGSDTVKFMVNHSSTQANLWCHKHYIVSLQLKVKKDDFPLLKVLAGALKARKNNIPVKTLLTICEGREGTELSDGDVLLFPEMIRYGYVTPSDGPELLDNHIVNGEIIDRIWRYNFTTFVFSFSKLLFVCL
ncbi:putative thioredoxin-like ferredoxin, Thioredoxin-like superfamily [Helianthus debilis subsp. tardiflorus]